MTNTYRNPERMVEDTIDRLGTDIRIATPLGLGKPVTILNEFYRRARTDSAIDLTIVTALSLIRPEPSGELERRLTEPMFDRIFGDYPRLEYAHDLNRGEVPGNVEIKQFYVKAGSQLSNAHTQQNHINTNYTYAVREILRQDINVIAQLVTPSRDVTDREEPVHSLSCNADLTFDLLDNLRDGSNNGRDFMVIGQVNTALPFMYGDCLMETGRFDGMLESEEYNHQLFGPPSEPLNDVDYAIGLHASRLVKDGGTLQVGIGSLSDAIARMLIHRHQNNETYRNLVDRFPYSENTDRLVNDVGGHDTFDDGLYASTEMFVRGFEELMRSGVLGREVYDQLEIQRYVNERDGDRTVELELIDRLRESGGLSNPPTAEDLRFLKRYGILRSEVNLAENRLKLPRERTVPNDLTNPDTREALRQDGLGDTLENGVVAHAGFFLGPSSFYDFLRELDGTERRQIRMERISFVNDLYGDQPLKEAQRTDARFINSGMKVTLSGAVVSDALEDMRVVSGVGGQYNFVAMAQDLPGARSIIMLPSTRRSDGELESNIVWNYGHTTIPRHLRDIVVTEYGIADLRGLTDRRVVESLLGVTDARFLDELVEKAKQSDKLPADWTVPESYRKNRPETVSEWADQARKTADLSEFPFGSQLHDRELVLMRSLKAFREKIDSFSFSPRDVAMVTSLFGSPEEAEPYLERMDLKQTEGWNEWYQQKVVLLALRMNGIV